MSVEKSNVIDIISFDKDENKVTLAISDHLEWGDGEHLMKLQNKLNTYLAFIESGEIFDEYPKASGKKIRLDVVCMYFPDKEGQ